MIFGEKIKLFKFKNKVLKRITYAVIFFIMSVSIFHAIGSLWAYGTSYETLLNNELFFTLPSGIEVSNAAMLNLKDFSTKSGDFTFKYPEFFILEKEEFDSGEILYHVELKNADRNILGFVQVWNIMEPLELFLDDYKIAADVTEINKSRINISGYWGIQWDYSISDSTGKIFKARQAFIDRKGKMYAISLFAPHEKWEKYNCDKIFSTISSTLRLLK